MSWSEDEDTVEFENVYVVGETQMALRVELMVPGQKHSRTLWIPKSVVHSDSEVFDNDRNSEGRLVLKQWFAEKEGLI